MSKRGYFFNISTINPWGFTKEFISSLKEEDFYSTVETGEDVKNVAQWLFITASHTALHFGKIQLLRSLLEDELDSPC